MNRKNAERLLSGEPVPPEDETGSPELDRLLAAAARPVEVDPGRAEAHEQAALEAFRAARAEALRAAGGSRGRDNWAAPLWRNRLLAPVGHRPARVAFGGLLAAGALGGVLLTAGLGGLQVPFAGGDSASTREPRGNTETVATESPSGTGSATPESERREPRNDVPDLKKLCRTYLGTADSGQGNGTGSTGSGGSGEGDSSRPDPDGYARLVDAAGGESEVDGYCVRLVGTPEPAEPGTSAPGNSAPGSSSSSNANSGGSNANSGGSNANSGGSNANSGGSNANSGGSNANSGGNNANSGGNNANSGGKGKGKDKGD